MRPASISWTKGAYQDYLADPSLFGAELDTVPTGSWVVVDEIQRLPNLLNEVHRFIEDRGLKFALLGSSARKLKAAGVNLLAGRALNKTMHPLTPAELGGDFGLEVALDSGTIPLVWVAEERRAVLESYVQLYLREEIRAGSAGPEPARIRTLSADRGSLPRRGRERFRPRARLRGSRARR